MKWDGSYGPTGAYMRPQGWHQTPRWHWRYWFGYRMRRYEPPSIPYEGDWEYRTFGQHARAVLEEQANGRGHDADRAEQRSASYIATIAKRSAQRWAS